MVSSHSSFHTTPASEKVILNKEEKCSCCSHHDGEQPQHHPQHSCTCKGNSEQVANSSCCSYHDGEQPQQLPQNSCT